MNDNSNKQTMASVLAELAHGSFAPFADSFADDIVWTIKGTTPWSRSYEGKQAVLAMLGAVASRIEGEYRMEPHRILADGDFVVVEGQGRNKLRGGGRYDNTYCWVCRLERGRLREVVEYMDTDLVLRVFSNAA